MDKPLLNDSVYIVDRSSKIERQPGLKPICFSRGQKHFLSVERLPEHRDKRKVLLISRHISAVMHVGASPKDTGNVYMRFTAPA